GTVHSAKDLKQLIDYVMNSEKTNDFEYVSGQNILDIHSTCDEMLATRTMAIALKNKPQKNEIYGYHFVQSFSPDDHLTPEQVHEIGCKTMKEYLGNSAEFIIATHTDKPHLHNHIVLNATNPLTLNKFQQSKNDLERLKEISDNISKEYGCKIIVRPEQKLGNSHKNYLVYLAQNSYRKEIKNKLEFLMNHAHTWEDFKEKASALNLKVDDTKKYTTYLLVGSEQTKKTRDRSLKNDKFLKENLIEHIEKNTIGYSVEEVVKLWNDKESIREKGQEKEIEMLLEHWQVTKETEKDLVVTIDTAFDNEATIKIPARCVDKLENGQYKIFIKKGDRFSYIDKRSPANHKIMVGSTVAKNLQRQSGNVPLYSDNVNIKLKQVFHEFDFLISQGLGFDRSFETIGEELKATYQETQHQLDKLDTKIIEYVEQNKSLDYVDTTIRDTIKN
ncbi:relaxase/mobilization nuclease domain-containing protein, partial [Lactococcus lactis]|uniref:relaxase/mobilization nuclease domain-containing protein n=1 Tax=Lactococcus lactis TaxID=1358 RepID=UPI00223ADBF6